MIVATLSCCLAYAWSRPFVQPLPVWAYKLWLIIPLALGVAIVYKSIRCDTMREVPKAAVILMLWILGAVLAAGVILTAVLYFVDWISA